MTIPIGKGARHYSNPRVHGYIEVYEFPENEGRAFLRPLDGAIGVWITPLLLVPDPQYDQPEEEVMPDPSHQTLRMLARLILQNAVHRSYITLPSDMTAPEHTIDLVGSISPVDASLDLPPVSTIGVFREVLRARIGQLRSGYTPSRDDTEHSHGELGMLAAMYLLQTPSHFIVKGTGATVNNDQTWMTYRNHLSLERREALIRGIALAVAEVERIDRAVKKP